MSGEAALIWAPFPDEDAAVGAIETLLAERLIACGNVLAGMRSVFLWHGAVESSREVGVLFKTTAAALEAAVARLAAIHPYEDPAILGWRCEAAAPRTLEWLVGAVPEPR